VSTYLYTVSADAQVVVIGAGQLVATKELPEFAPLTEQVATGTLVVVNGAGHVVSV